MSRLNVNSVNPHDGVKVSVTGSTNGGVVISGSGDNVGNPLLAVHGTVSASGNLTASNAFFSGDIHGVGNIYVQGHATLSAYTAGGIQLGDTNTDNVTFGADVNSHIIPNVNNTYDLGSDAQEWRNIYVEGTGYIDTIIQDDSSITNTFKGDSQFIDDAGSVSLQVHSSDGNIGVKVSDPNVDFEVAGNISSSGWLSLGGAGSANGTKGHLTASGNAIISGTLEVLGGALFSNVTASNISASNHLYGGLNTFTSRINSLPNRTHLLITTPITASSTISASSTVLAGGYRVDGLVLADNVSGVLTLGDTDVPNVLKGHLTTSANISASSQTATHSFDGLLQVGPAGAPQGKVEIQNISGDAQPSLKLKQLDVSQFALRTEGARSVVNHSSLRSNTGDSIIRAGDSAMNGILEVFGGGTSGKTVIGNNISGSHVTGDHILGGTLTIGTSTLVLAGNDGHITASGNISAVGYSAGALGMSTSHITMSGNLTGSSTSEIDVRDIKANRAIYVGAGAGEAASISSSGALVAQNITASNNLTVFGNLVGKGNIALGDNTADKITLIGNVTSSGIMDFTNTTNATDASGDTGALRVEGGISVAQSLFAEQLNATENIKAGAMISSSGILVGKNITASNNLRVDGTTTLLGGTQLGDNTADAVRVFGNITSSGILDLTNTTNATDASGDTGALRVEGGISVAQDVYSAGTFFATTEGFAASTVHTGFISSSGMLVGQNITASNNLQVEGKVIFNGTTQLGNNTADTVTILGNVTSSGILDFTNTTNATDASGDTGALRVEGGASIKQDVYSDGTFFASTEGFAASTVHTGFVSSSGMLVGQNITASRHISGSSTSRLDMQDGYFGRAVHAGAGAGVEAIISSSGNMITNNFTASNNATFNGADSNLMVINPKVSASAEIGALVLHGRHSGSSQANSGGAISTTITEANFPGGTVFGVNQSTAGNAVAFTLPAATAGLEYTFIASVTSGNTTTTISAPSAILKGMAICKDANEDISGTNFIFAATKFEIGTRVTCIADGAIWHVTAICPCDVADVSTT